MRTPTDLSTIVAEVWDQHALRQWGAYPGTRIALVQNANGNDEFMVEVTSPYAPSTYEAFSLSLTSSDKNIADTIMDAIELALTKHHVATGRVLAVLAEFFGGPKDGELRQLELPVEFIRVPVRARRGFSVMDQHGLPLYEETFEEHLYKRDEYVVEGNVMTYNYLYQEPK